MINNFASIMHNKILIIVKLFVIDFTSILATNLKDHSLFLDFLRNTIEYTTASAIHVLTKYRLIKRYRSKRIKLSIKNQYPNYVPRNPRNDAFDMKVLENPQLQVIV